MSRVSVDDTIRPSAIQQVWPVANRLLKTLRRKWFSSLIQIVIAPLLVLGIYIYLLQYLSNDENKESQIMKNSETFISVAMFLSTCSMVINFAQMLTVDKQTNFKALMISMGLRKVSYYIGSFIVFLGIILIPTLVSCAASLVYQFPETQVNRSWIILIYLLFAIHLVGYTFAFSSLITSTNFITLIYIPLIFEFFNHALIKYVALKYPQLDPGWILFFTSASPYESLKIFGDSYCSCGNCNKSTIDGLFVSQPVHLIAIAMSFWTVLAFAFGLWFNEVCPWKKDSDIKSLLFCLKPKSKLSQDQQPPLPNSHFKYFEKRPVSITDIGIRINGVSKLYNSIPVVNNLTFNIFKGETTLLLGHNGAGKTTLMNMILGKTCPDYGKVFIRKSSSQYVESTSHDYGIGVCPQSSVLDEYLTVTDHLELLYDIKTSSNGTKKREAVRESISDLRLDNHSHCYPSQISGGMKRKLSLGMALVGKSDILILDEPSSGLDPDSRVWVWNIIKRFRGSRTVLLSTQHMEEADYLGDRIAIMSKGTIVCCGSSIFLNKTFNSGYKLRVDCLASKRRQVFEFVKTYFNSAKLSEVDQLDSLTQREDQVQDMVIQLTEVHQDSEKKLIEMLDYIENNSKALHIHSHGLRSSSIEDVMLKTSNFEIENSQSSAHLPMNTNESLIDKLVSTPLEAGLDSYRRQIVVIKALLTKFLHVYKRTWKTILVYRLLLPAFTIWASIKNTGFRDSYSPQLLHAFYVIHFIASPVSERVSNFKTVQLSSGASRRDYWLSYILVDLISTAINIILINVLYATSFTGIYIASGVTIHLILTFSMLIFNVASILFAYVTSFFFKDSKNAPGYFILLYLIPGFLNFLILILLIALHKDIKIASYTQLGFMIFFPSNAFDYLLYGLGSQCLLYDNTSCGISKPLLGVSPITVGFIILCIQIVGYGFLLTYLEYARLNFTNWSLFSLCSTRKVKHSQLIPIDEDVTQESRNTQQIISSASRDDHILVVNDLVKSYVKDIKVIDHLSFSVKKRECFGLLGVNGAGKSTTFSMVVADFKQDSGIIWLNGLYNTDDIDLYRRSLGYDPQSEPDFALSPIEALTLMARLRFVQERRVPELVNGIIDLLEMSEHSQKNTDELSGGTKRKLALGMSLIGNPKLLALDEPTAGVDPMARRNIWNLLKSLRNKGDCSVMISSHAMEECEAICDRIGIMAGGRLRCIGSFLHLRTKFVKGCHVKIQFSQNESSPPTSISNEAIISEITTSLSSALNCRIEVTDTNMSNATLTVLATDFKRSKILKTLRQAKKKFKNISYVINDPSLEDIFITIAQEQGNVSTPKTSVVADL